MTPTKGKGRHTPGPWSVSRDGVPEWHKQYTVYSEQGERVATAFLDEANARLIATAPELLAFVQMLLASNDVPEGPIRSQARGLLYRVSQ